MDARRGLRYAVVVPLVVAGTYIAGAAPASAAVNPVGCTVQENGGVTLRYSGIEANLPAGDYTLDILQRVGHGTDVQWTKLASTTRPVSAGGYIGFKGHVTQAHKKGRIVDVLHNRRGATGTEALRKLGLHVTQLLLDAS